MSDAIRLGTAANVSAAASSLARRALLLVAVLLGGVWVWNAWSSGDRPMVVYCAHDAIFAEQVLRQFERETGIPLEIRYDTEATKSLGLVELLMRERSQPRCDVFWNNELLGTLELAEQGLLQPYRGTAWANRPPTARDEAGRWIGFAGRFRVWVLSENGPIEASEAAIAAACRGPLDKVARAQPMYGTTLTQYALAWQHQGRAAVQQQYKAELQRGLVELAGNARVKDAVVAGQCDLGQTDTDDVFVGRDAGAPLRMVPLRINGQTVCIPNTAAIVRGTRQLPAAQRLMDYLGSAEVELALARSPARQIPLGPVDASQLPEEIRPLLEWSRDAADLRNLLPARRECLQWLRTRAGA